MKIVSQNSACGRKYPGVYRDTRDNEVCLFLSPNNFMVLRKGDGGGGKASLREKGHVGCMGLTSYDVLCDDKFVISND